MVNAHLPGARFVGKHCSNILFFRLLGRNLGYFPAKEPRDIQRHGEAIFNLALRNRMT